MFDIKHNSLELATRKHGCGGNVLGHNYGNNNNSHNNPYAQPWTVGYPWPSAQACCHCQGGCNSTYAPMYAPMYPQSRTQTYAPWNTVLCAPSISPTWAASYSPSSSISNCPPPLFFPPPFFPPFFWDFPLSDLDIPPWDPYDLPPGNWPRGWRGWGPGRWNYPFTPGFDPFGPSGWPGDPYWNFWDPWF